MNENKSVEDEVTSLLTTFQSVFFGISEGTVLSELDRKLGDYSKEEASRFFALYQPLVQEMLNAISKYERPVPNGVYSEDSFDVEQLAQDVASGHAGVDPEYLKRIARKIVYWRYLR